MKVYLLATIGTDGVVRPVRTGGGHKTPFASSELSTAKSERTRRIRVSGGTRWYVIYECDTDTGTVTKIIG